jgi:hypothetical protein
MEGLTESLAEGIAGDPKRALGIKGYPINIGVPFDY